VHIVRDLLDKQIVDRNGREMGRVDRIVMAAVAGSQPTVIAIEVGASALGTRLGRAFGRWIAGILHGFGVDTGQPVRIHVSQILDAADKVKVDLAFGETPAANVERSLARLVSRLPGARR